MNTRTRPGMNWGPRKGGCTRKSGGLKTKLRGWRLTTGEKEAISEPVLWRWREKGRGISWCQLCSATFTSVPFERCHEVNPSWVLPLVTFILFIRIFSWVLHHIPRRPSTIYSVVSVCSTLRILHVWPFLREKSAST